MTTAMADDAKNVSDIPISVIVELPRIGDTPRANVVTANESSQEDTSDTDNDIIALPKERRISEKRRAQNLMFSDWYDARATVSPLGAHLSTGCPSERSSSPRGSCKA